PLAHLLVLLRATVHAIGYIAAIADDDGPGLLLHGRIDHSTADLVLQIPHHTGMLGLHAGFRTDQALMTSGAFPLLGNGLRHHGHGAGMTLALSTTLPTRDDRCLMLIANNGRVDLPQVHRHHVLAGRRLGLLAVLDDDVPGVAVSQLVVDQPDLQE